MADLRPLLIELGCEELPPKALDELAGAFAQAVREELDVFHFALGDAEVFCSPRRMAVRFTDVAVASPKAKTTLKAVPVKIGWDAEGKPTAPLMKKAAQLGVAADAFRPESDAPNAMLLCEVEMGGEALAALLPGVIERALKRLPIPKPMRWGDHDYAFVRPLHWLVVLHGSEIVAAQILGVRSGRQSRGHRFHHPQPVHLADADAYVEALRAAHVLADPAERRARIRDEVARAGAALGAQPRLRDALLDEIANLTEWPVAITCAFEREFLRVPQEALIQTMEANQKFVPVFGAEPGSEIADRRSARSDEPSALSPQPSLLTEHFIGIANIASKDPAEIRKGYERVIRPRFADAKFFFDEDLKTPLAAHQDALKSVTYQQQLGSVWDKCVRVAELARVIANRSGVDAGRATRAAALAKCDLMTRMVGEFPELQGTMGRYYASANGEDAEIANALDEFYAPRFAGDAIAAGPVGRVLAVAERIDTLCGIFAVGLKPSGNKDPFALRRAALGLARTLIEGAIALDLKAQFAEALALLPETALAAGLPKPRDGKAPAFDAGARRGELAVELYEFVIDRLRGYYAEQGIGAEAFEAVRALAPSDLLDFDRRLRAVVAFAALPEAQALAAANKRISNILRQAGHATQQPFRAELLEPGAELALGEAVLAAIADAAPLIAHGDYVGLLTRLAALRAPVDAFFDHVMVMVDDAAKRANRLALLSNLRTMFLRVADISLLPAPERS